ncbi:MAG: tetratricopeptide repeat protein [Candidatus Methylomirabilales bacterium]
MRSRLAEKGDRVAQYFLGTLYSTGWWEDHNEAMKWYRKAAKQGCSSSMFSIGFRYERGEGVEYDLAEAVRWYKMAAEGGHAGAMRNLADIYADIPDYRSELLAYMWYDIASKYAESPLFASKKRDEIARRMTPAQIKEAKQLVKGWERKHGI